MPYSARCVADDYAAANIGALSGVNAGNRSGVNGVGRSGVNGGDCSSVRGVDGSGVNGVDRSDGPRAWSLSDKAAVPKGPRRQNDIRWNAQPRKVSIRALNFLRNRRQRHLGRVSFGGSITSIVGPVEFAFLASSAGRSAVGTDWHDYGTRQCAR